MSTTMMSSRLRVLFAALWLHHVTSFVPTTSSFRKGCIIFSARGGEESDDDAANIDPSISGKFKILACSSTSCAQKRKVLRMDEYATFGALYERIQNSDFDNVDIEESPCLGSCKMAPCVGVEHDEFDGQVSLLGMTDNEFVKKSFHNVLTEEDADRVWECVDGAIRLMAEEEESQSVEEVEL